MSEYSESAEQTVKMTLEGMDYFLRIVGNVSKETILAIHSIMENKTQTKGKTTLTNMVKSGEPVSIFSLPKNNIKNFATEAKKYGVVYVVVKDKADENGKIDIIVKDKDKAKIDRIIKKFETNISGISIEHLINTLLNVKDMNSETFLFQLENKKKLKKLGKLPSMIHQIPILLNRDGTITALNKEDEKRVNEVNKVTNIIKEKIKPLIKYIKADVFDNELIMSQELVINKKDNVLAKCDLSTKNKILEIKAFIPDIDKIKYQLYYEANGREIYILQTKWNRNLKKGLIFTLYKVDILENTKKIKKINDNSNNPQINKKALERKVAKRVSNYFNEEGNRWSLGCMTFKSTDDFNYQYLKEYINKNKINIKELSASIDVSENAVRNWINGKSRPYVWNAIAICICLDIDERKIIIKK